jgi:putative glutamine amidotransferase
MGDIRVTIGVSVRPDQGGDAHKYDMDAVQSAKHLFGKPIRIGTSKEMVTINVEARALPSGIADVKDGDLIAQARSDFEFERLVSDDLNCIDLLYIPGGPAATPTQQTNIHKMKVTQPGPDQPDTFKTKEARTRNEFEAKLISTAMNRGIPVLAVCAGSWRLLESCGGKVRELSKADVKTHRDAKNLWALHHDLRVEPGQSVMSAASSWSKGDLKGANTTHWAVADEASFGEKFNNKARQQPLSQEERDSPRPPVLHAGDFLQVVAREPITNGIEGFESQFGMPLMGAQWHPESNLPGQPGASDDLAIGGGMVRFSQEIFRMMILAAVTAKLRRSNVVSTLRSEFGAIKLKPVGAAIKAQNESKRVLYPRPTL